MGGNVFENGSTQIKKEYINDTLDKFIEELKRIFPNAKQWLEQTELLGSAGKKDISGDIDIALDEQSLSKIEYWGISQKHVDNLFENFKKRARTSTDHQIMNRAFITAIADKINENSKIICTNTKQSGSGVLYCQFPQYYKDNKLDIKVQIDINFGNLDWLRFAYYSDSYQGNIKGLHRTQLILHLFANKGYVFSHNYGVKNKDTQEIVANTSQEAIDLLNTLYKLKLDDITLSNYNNLQNNLRSNLKNNELNAIYDIYLKTLDSTRCDIPEDLQQYWIDNKDRLGLTGKFLPEQSKLKKLCQDQ